ncbi:hypothetical protein SAMN02910339_02459 [Lachnospiraceae bacterium YSD2013]|nr:hypothetical protein SAMN02910339_02459 [Lachnospiraceae bacterium YSD2013]
MDLESIVNVTKILAFAAATLGAIIGIGVFLNQTRISITLMSHEERERHRVFRTIAVFLCFVVFCYAMGFLATIFNISTDLILQQNNAESTITGQKDIGASDNDISVQVTQGEQIIKELDVKIIIGGIIILLLVAIIAGTIYALDIKKQEIGRTQYYKVRKWHRYLVIGFMLFLAIILLETNMIIGFASTIKDYAIIGIIVSGLHGFFCACTICSSANEYTGEISHLKSFYEGKVVYLFELEGNSFVAGDNMYVSDCEEFYLIPMTNLKAPLVDAQSEDDVYLEKKKVEICSGLKSRKNRVLRGIAADCKKRNIDLNGGCELKVELVDKRIKYTVKKDSDEKCIVIEDKPVNHEEWDGNVLLL